MRAVIQRVTKASVSVKGELISSIRSGMLIFLGIEVNDNMTDVDWLVNKIAQLRIFRDQEGVMNKSIIDIKGSVLVVSQFTLHAKTKKGNRPSYINAAKPEISLPLYEAFNKKLSIETSKDVATGEFGEMMEVNIVNDGPVTIIIDTKNKE